jgi:SAM-dependent methyltransferase
MSHSSSSNDQRRSQNVLGVALAAGCVVAAVCWLAYRLPPPSTSDLDPPLIGARALLAGRDPYAAVAETQPYPLFYPLPALILVAPIALLPTDLARVVWAGIGGFVFALAAMRYRRGLPIAMLSASFLNAIVLNQWSPLLTAAAVFPLLGAFAVAKPSIGAAVLVAYPSWRAVAGAVGLLLLSLIVMPHWPAEWVAALRHSNHVAPVLRPGGVILLLALLRWKRPEARLLAALACVPQTIGLYETLPLFLIPRTRREAYLLAGLSYVAAFGTVLAFPRTAGVSLEQNLAARWPLVFALLYLPALVLVLRAPRSPTTDAP